MLILLVDDDDQFRDVIQMMLERQGHTVVIARNGNEAVKRFREQPPHLVITDLIMPDKEGLETIHDLRRITPGVKIIAMSGGGRATPMNYLKIAEGIGAAASLAKPFTNQQLTDAILVAMAAGNAAA
jgi:CheY-like chemotaxis protein